MKPFLEAKIRTVAGVKVSFLAVFGLMSSCRAPCASGFDRGSDGICYAVNVCEPGEARGQDLVCHPTGGSAGDTAQSEVQVDTGDSEPARDTGGDDSGAPASGPGRIQVRYDGLPGYPAHGFIVFAKPEATEEPIAAFCQIILASEVDVSGYLQAYDGASDPCPSFGEAMVFEPGPMQVSMVVSSGASSDASLCDERVIQVSGDTTVDFSGVTACSE